MPDEIKFTREEILDAVAECIALKKAAGEDTSTTVDGANDHELVSELYTASLTRAKESGKNIFSAMADVVREDPKLGKRFLGYVFEE